MKYEDKIEALKQVIRLMTDNTLTKVTLGDIEVIKEHHEDPNTDTMTPEELAKQTQEELDEDLFYSSGT